MMAGEAEAGDAPKPFNWQEIEDEDELSFGSEYESDGDAAADASSPQLGEAGGKAGDAAAHRTGDDIQRGLASPKAEAGAVKVEDIKPDPAEDDAKDRKADLLQGTIQHESKPLVSKAERKAPRTPVRWTPPPSKAGDTERAFAPASGGVRGKPVASRGAGAVQTTVHKKGANPVAASQPRGRGPWGMRAPLAAREAMLSSIGGGLHDPKQIGQFMNKRKPDFPHRSYGDGMGSALNQLKTHAPAGPSNPSGMMNPAARPFTPRPPSNPPQHLEQSRPLQQPRPPLQPQRPSQQIPRSGQQPLHLPAHQPPQRPQIAGSMQYAFTRPVHPRPSGGAGYPVIAPASTWVRGQSDSVDDEAAQKSVKSSTWVNPNVATTVVSRPVAATAAVAPVKNEDDATAEALRRKDEEIAALRAKLERQVAPKRQHEEVKEEGHTTLQPAPRKVLRAGDGARAAQLTHQPASMSDGRRGEDPPRPRRDIFSRLQFGNRIHAEVVQDEKPVPARSPRSPSPVHRPSDHRKESQGRDSGRHLIRKAPERGGQGGRHGDDRRHKPDMRWTDKQQPDMSEEQKLRLQRFGSKKLA